LAEYWCGQIKDVMDTVKPENRWMHAYTYSAHPTCCAVALKNIEILEREQLCENASNMGDRLYAALVAAFRDHPNAGDIRGGKDFLPQWSLLRTDPRRRTSPASAGSQPGFMPR